jgi:hypothetical protein
MWYKTRHERQTALDEALSASIGWARSWEADGIGKRDQPPLRRQRKAAETRAPKEGLLANLATKNLLLDLNWFPQTGMGRVVITAPLTERFATAPHATVGTNSRSTISTCSHRTIATGHPYVTVTLYVFDLAVAVHCKSQQNAPDSVKSWGI